MSRFEHDAVYLGECWSRFEAAKNDHYSRTRITISMNDCLDADFKKALQKNVTCCSMEPGMAERDTKQTEAKAIESIESITESSDT